MAELPHDCHHTRRCALLRRATLEFIANTWGCAVIRASISTILRRRIVILARQGMATRHIAAKVHRGEAAVIRVISDELDYVERYRARLSVQLGEEVARLVAQMETRCRQECYEESEVA